MKYSFVILLMILTGSCSHEGHPGDPEALRKVLFNYYDGIKDHDQQKMTDATTADFLLYEQGKVWNNDSVFAEMGRHPYTVKFTFDNLHTTIDREFGHVAYTAQANFVFDDTVKLRLDFLESAVFTRQDGAWKMSFLHVTERPAQPRYDTIRYAPEYYAQRVAEFAKEPVQKGNIIFLGNSIVEYGNWRKLLQDSTVVNRGVAADNTFGVLERLEDIIARQPSKLFIEIGINDISQNIPVDIIVNNITTIADRVKTGSPQTKIYVISILPTNDNVRNEYPDAYNKNNVTDEVNERLQSIAGENSFTYVDLNSALRTKDGKLDEKYANADGLHLNSEGYRVFVTLLRSKKYI